MVAASRNPVTEFVFKHHPTIYRRTGGRIGGKIGSVPLLLLNTKGRKSGQPRTNALMCVERENGWAVAASWAGEPKHPVWYLNLMAEPETTIEWEGRIVPVRARVLEGEERETVWQEIVQQDDGFSVYEERTRGIREIPVVLLEKNPVRVLYGLSCSYYTGKLEAYFQAKGIPFQYVEMNRTQFRACGEATGVMQLPCVQEPDGSWLTDTTDIIAHFEEKAEGPQIRPADPVTAFCSQLLEDLFDEWYWRPALYYRWAHDEDAALMSTELARELLRDMPLPLFVRRRMILHRQRRVYLKQDGVTPETAPAIEKQYLDSLRELDTIFASRDYLLGDTPSEAGYGLFGPFFRHFFCDPTSGALMRKHAPNLTHWVTRLWKMRPEELAGTNPPDSIPEGLEFFFNMIAEDYLPYLEANAAAVARGQHEVTYEAQGLTWTIPVAPYRVRCLNDLKAAYAALDGEERLKLREYLPDQAAAVLSRPDTQLRERNQLVGRLWLPA